jgi:hypothetical protein
MTIASKFGIPQSLLDAIANIQKEETEYQSKVKALMAKKGIKSLGDLSADEKKAFFNQLDSMHQAKNEEVKEQDMKHPEDVKTSANVQQKSGAKKWLSKEWKKGSKVNEAEVGGGTSIRDTQVQAKGQAERAKVTLQSAMLKLKQAKEREALAKKKQAIKSEFDPTVEELSPKQKKIDLNKNGKIDGSDLANLRKEEGDYSEFKQGGEKLANKFEKALAKLGVKTKIKMKTVGNVSVNEDNTNEACWDGYKQDGMKKKGDKMVPNCVPEASSPAQQAAIAVAMKKAGKKPKDLDEAKSGYDIYHKDFSTAVQHAIKTAEKRGYEVDMDDWHDKVATGPRKPSEGKTNSYSIKLSKAGKPQKKALQMQVYNKGGQNPYELNMYIEDVNVNAMFSEAMKKDKEKDVVAAKDDKKQVKNGDKLSGKKEPIEIEPELDNRNSK